jgi:ABC-type Fe3+/spermidine/putrescine transport system ATPase subunit
MLRPDVVEQGSETWTAVLLGRPIACSPPGKVAADGRYLVALRPDRIRIVSSEEEADIGPVTVLATTYKGRDTEVESKLTDGQQLKFLVPASSAGALPKPGAVVQLTWRPHRALLVAAADDVEA